MPTLAPICTLRPWIRKGCPISVTTRDAMRAASAGRRVRLWMITNSSPPMRATMSVCRTHARIRSATRRSSVSPQRWPKLSFTGLNPSRSMQITANAAASPSRSSSVSMRQDRLARPVSASCPARKASRSSACWRSVTSRCVVTQPPPGIGEYAIMITRPLPSRCWMRQACEPPRRDVAWSHAVSRLAPG